MKEDLEPFYTVKEVAAMLRVSTATVYRRVQDQRWPAHEVGTSLRFDKEDIDTIKELTRKKPKVSTAPPRPRVGTRARRPRLQERKKPA